MSLAARYLGGREVGSAVRPEAKRSSGRMLSSCIAMVQ
jgi:hypothetical protein